MLPHLARCLFLSLFVTLAPLGVMAEERQTALRQLFEAPAAEAEWFTQDFLNAVPAATVDRIVAGLRTDFGDLRTIALDGDAGTLSLERAEVPVNITLDAEGRIAGLFFGPPRAMETDPARFADTLRAAALGDVALLVRVGGVDLVAEKADEALAVGSAFKLFVLRAYEDAIARGDIQRADVVMLEEADGSLPSGILQNAPAGLPVTLETLATLMIQISDNTATDALIRVLGRDTIEAISPRNVPFLTTGEAFRLKARAERSNFDAFVGGSAEERRAVLDNLIGAPLPAIGDLRTETTWEVEWFATARELCDLLDTLADAPAMTLPTTAPLKAEDWAQAAFKGGSEPGVLNLSARATRQDSTPACVVFTANADEAQPDERLALLFAALASALR